MRRIVVIRPGALGDTLVAFPALAALHRRWPSAHLTLIARNDVLALARATGLATATYPFDLPEWGYLFGGLAPERHPLVRAVFGGADAAVGWLGDPEGIVTRNLARQGIARVVIGGRPPGASPREHVALTLLHTLEALDVGPAPASVAEVAKTTPRLEAPAAAIRSADTLWSTLRLPNTGVVALHTGSGGAAKRWPPAYFAGLVRRLYEASCAPLLLEGPADACVVEALRTALAVAEPGSATGVAMPPVASGLSVEELAAVLGRCAAYVGNDSGVSHLAALAGCPTLALFGPSDPGVWAPIGLCVRVLRAPAIAGGSPDLAALSAEAAWAGLDALLRQ